MYSSGLRSYTEAVRSYQGAYPVSMPGASGAPTHRHRSKSAPRGRSPDPKSLKKAATKAKQNDAYTTPPPRKTSKESSSSNLKVRRAITFKDEDRIHEIEAENKGPGLKKADEILKQLKDLWGIIFWELPVESLKQFRFQYVCWYSVVCLVKTNQLCRMKKGRKQKLRQRQKQALHQMRRQYPHTLNIGSSLRNPESLRKRLVCLE